MRFPRNIDVDSYDKVTVRTSGLFTVSLNIEEGGDEMELILYASESKALRKALKAAEASLTTSPYRKDSSV